ncbi:MAG: toprim domain-containing protein [Deltaproteobacteria bacterium]|jgi:DNA primase
MATQWVDFRAVKRRVSLEDVLFTYYGLGDALTRRGTKVTGPCPVHRGDSLRAFSADLSRNVWHCFSRCAAGGNVLDLVARREDISIREAALRLDAFFKDRGEVSEGESVARANADVAKPATTTEPPSAPPRADDLAPQANPPISVRLALRGDHPHLLDDRGLTPETIAHFGVGYCARGILRGTIATPVRNELGELVAYLGRRLKPSEIAAKGKYVWPNGFHKQHVVFNLDRALRVSETLGLIVVEGVFTVMALHQMGFANAVAVLGCEVSPQQCELLSRAPDITLMFDGDEAGRAGALATREALVGRVQTRLVHLPEGAEPEDLTPRALRWLTAGMRTLDLDEVSLSLPRR